VTGAPAALLRASVGSASVWCSGRAGGNVGDAVGDVPDNVAQNRTRLAADAGLPEPQQWVWLRQVHGSAVHLASGPTPADDPPMADAAVTPARGLPLAVVTADCAPVVIANDTAVGIAHAGHRGLAAGVVGATVEAVRANGRGEVRAFLGPCIRAEHYEFGADDLRVLARRFGDEVVGRTAAGRPAFDLAAGVRVALRLASVEHFEDCARDTAAEPDEWFSYRRERETGRQATVVLLH
jgi:polyphenol oxidase